MMKQHLLKSILSAFFVFMVLSVSGQQVERYNMLIDFNRQFNFYYFEQLRAYIINNGDRKTYCPSYKDNPHLRIGSLLVDIYLNPTNNDGFEPSKNDYNVMYLLEEQGSKSVHYYLYLNPRRDVFLYDFDNQFQYTAKREDAVVHLEKIIEKILIRYGII